MVLCSMFLMSGGTDVKSPSVTENSRSICNVYQFVGSYFSKPTTLEEKQALIKEFNLSVEEMQQITAILKKGLTTEEKREYLLWRESALEEIKKMKEEFVPC